jgi:ferric-dicitrate binding protein FerR (iron transport regulator)
MKRWQPADDIPHTAAQWFAARRGGADAAMEREFQNWLQAGPRHADDYAMCEIA